MNVDFCIISKRTGEQRENRGVAAKLQVYTCASSLLWNLSINISDPIKQQPNK